MTQNRTPHPSPGVHVGPYNAMRGPVVDPLVAPLSAQRLRAYLFLFFLRALTKMSVDPSGPGARPKYSV